jgi:hypothetical protein
MRNRVNGIFVVLALVLSTLIWSGCSKKSQPSDKDNVKVQPQAAVSEVQAQYSSKKVSMPLTQPSDAEIIKAIDDSGTMKRADGSFTVVPPVKVVEKGKWNKNGAMPVKVKFTLKYKMKDGKISPPTATTSLFMISEVKDSMGKSAWKAQLGS